VAGRSTAVLEVQRRERLRAHEYLAEQLRRQIALQLVQPGQALPPERELSRLFGVGRRTVREAIGLLVQDGLIESRRGRTGGNFVVRGSLAGGQPSRLVDQLREDRSALEEALVYRLELEPAAAARAAVAASGEDLVRIRTAAQRAAGALGDAEFMERDTEFHLAIARASHNRLLAEGIERVRVLLGTALIALPASDLWHGRTNEEHAAIVVALEAGDAVAARSAMRLHVQHTERSIQALLAALEG
jgi:DNA-binding FadR family transcriptional regulator